MRMRVRSANGGLSSRGMNAPPCILVEHVYYFIDTKFE